MAPRQWGQQNPLSERLIQAPCPVSALKTTENRGLLCGRKLQVQDGNKKVDSAMRASRSLSSTKQQLVTHKVGLLI